MTKRLATRTSSTYPPRGRDAMICGTGSGKKTERRHRIRYVNCGGIAALRLPADLVGKIIGEIGIEVRVVGRLDSRLRLMRLLRRCGKFRQAPLVRRIQPQKIVLVQLVHPLRHLEERLT